jgi:hypothetical protein
MSMKPTIEEMQKIAKKHRGLCLSEKYVSALTKLKWQCNDNHKWEATPNSIKNGTWCPYCAGNVKFTIEDMKEIAKKRGGKCLSDEYINLDTKLKWRCKEGHIWETTPYCIKNRKFWCPKCAGKQKLTIEEMNQIANERRGKCLSKEYIDGFSKLKWQCEMGHVWEASPNHVKTGSWCPICSSNVSERICRGISEGIFDKDFPKSKPKWLINSRGNRMELDGYCEELQLAFEYQGEQHYNYNSFFHSERNLKTSKEDDEFKKKLCLKNNILLIIIPFTIRHEEIYRFIINECKKNRFRIPKHKKIDYKKIDKYLANSLREMKIIASKRGGECLSNTYINNKSKMKWQCSNGHIWEAHANSIKRGTWCQICCGNKKRTIEEVKVVAINRGGNCISNEYKGAHAKLKWRCALGHVWEAAPHGVINKNSWCPICHNLKRKKYG